MISRGICQAEVGGRRLRSDDLREITPQVPSEFVAVDLVNTALVSDADLLSFLGANATPASVPSDLWMVR